MYKRLFKSILLSGLFLLFTAGVSHAAISVRLDQPKSPTNENNFNVSFVAMDTEGGGITVKCLKKGPSDGVFTQFGSNIALSSGGNAGNCASVSSFVSSEGTYQFQAEATGTSGTTSSTTVSVDYKTSGPGTPTNFSKDKIFACVYRIKFRTADDGGKTTKVKLFRTDSTNTTASEVASVSIGSNTDGQFENTVPDCSKDYLYAIRAYDAAGNESGIVGDSITTVTSTTTTTTLASAQGTGAEGVLTEEGVGGPIPVGEGESAVIEEEGAGEGTGEDVELTEEVLGEADEDQGLLSPRNILIFLALAALVSGFVFYKRFKKKFA